MARSIPSIWPRMRRTRASSFLPPSFLIWAISQTIVLYWGRVYLFCGREEPTHSRARWNEPMAEAKSLRTKRLVMIVCQGCCCGGVERGRPEVPTEWLKGEWRRRGLLKRLQLSISGCLGPCDVPNVVVIASETS